MRLHSSANSDMVWSQYSTLSTCLGQKSAGSFAVWDQNQSFVCVLSGDYRAVSRSRQKSFPLDGEAETYDNKIESKLKGSCLCGLPAVSEKSPCRCPCVCWPLQSAANPRNPPRPIARTSRLLPIPPCPVFPRHRAKAPLRRPPSRPVMRQRRRANPQPQAIQHLQTSPHRLTRLLNPPPRPLPLRKSLRLRRRPPFLRR